MRPNNKHPRPNKPRVILSAGIKTVKYNNPQLKTIIKGAIINLIISPPLLFVDIHT